MRFLKMIAKVHSYIRKLAGQDYPAVYVRCFLQFHLGILTNFRVAVRFTKNTGNKIVTGTLNGIRTAELKNKG